MEGKQSSAYEVIRIENGYVFLTDNGVWYKISFIKSNPYIKPVEYSDNIYSFSFDCDKDNGSEDSKICNTIAKSLFEFMQNPNNIIYFICDVNDNRQALRNRLFERWYRKHANNKIKKINTTFIDENSSIDFFMSMLYNVENPFAKKVSTDFYSYIQDLDSEK